MIAQHIFNHQVIIKRKIPTEVTPAESAHCESIPKKLARPLMLQKLNISLIPVEGGQWFALKGWAEGFSSPANFIKYLSEENFVDAGAAVTESPSLSICLAAMKSFQASMQKEIGQKEEATN